MLQGKGVADEPEAQDNGEGLVPERDPAPLVEKYTSCSLFPMFDGMVKSLLQDNNQQAPAE